MIRPSDRDMSRTTRDGPRLDQAIVAARQRVIRRHPEQYFWLHIDILLWKLYTTKHFIKVLAYWVPCMDPTIRDNVYTMVV